MIRITESSFNDIWPVRTKVIPRQRLTSGPSTPFVPEHWKPCYPCSSLIIDPNGWFICQTSYLGKIEIFWEEPVLGGSFDHELGCKAPDYEECSCGRNNGHEKTIR